MILRSLQAGSRAHVFVSRRSGRSALLGCWWFVESTWETSERDALNGSWDFILVSTPEHTPHGFHEFDFHDETWSE